uniref:Putative serine/threonine protein kinase n=1 Tax=Pithovirus LCPAC202 TaxID=2506592 RepID=A0A481Z6Q7_9VIRU|nr:MAG: putative serine/threonine protein kinase [Pithovirus LCPAC202]
MDQPLIKQGVISKTNIRTRLDDSHMDFLNSQFERLTLFLKPITEDDKKDIINQAVELIIETYNNPESGIRGYNYYVYLFAALVKILTERDLFQDTWYNKSYIYHSINRLIVGKQGEMLDHNLRQDFLDAQKEIGKGIPQTLIDSYRTHQITNNEYQKRFKILDKIGEGVFGKVYKVYDNLTKRETANKEITFSYLPSDEEKENFQIEMKIMKTISSTQAGCDPYIACLYEWYCVTPSLNDIWSWKYVINMEYIRGETLKLAKITSDQEALKIMLQMAKALHRLHDNNIIHMDLTTYNVMIDSEQNAKLIDFGTSCTSREECKLWSHVAGGIPELLKNTNMTLDQYKSSDIWMLGNLYKFILTKRPNLNVKPLVLKMMDVDLLKRPSIGTVISSLHTLIDQS